MKGFTTIIAALALLALMFSGLQAQDDITFQVNMSVQSDEGQFDPGAGDIVVVRGEFNGWAGTNEQLTDANTDEIYDGTFNITTGTTPQFYKFVIVSSGGDFWEGDPNREVVLTGSPQTLPVVWFNRDSVANVFVDGTVLFQINMEAATAVGLFDAANNDSVFAYGSFNNWGPNDDNFLMDNIFGDPFGYELNANINAEVGSNILYKHYLDRDDTAFDGWEEPATQGGGNRIVNYAGTTTQTEDMRWFMDIPNEGVISSGSVTVHLSVDMTPATALSDPFDPAVDNVYLSGEDQFFGWTQGWDPQRGVQGSLVFTDDNSDMVYELTMTLNTPTYYALVYRVCFGETADATTCEGGGFDFGKSRSRYIWNGSSIPTDHTFPMDVYTQDPPLVVEPHPHAAIVGLEYDLPGEVLPATYNLSQNYPNPFNPETTIQFSLSSNSDVSLVIYNALGQQVRNLYSGNVQPGTHRYTWNGTNDAGNPVTSGVYFYKLNVDNQSSVRKMVLMR